MFPWFWLLNIETQSPSHSFLGFHFICSVFMESLETAALFVDNLLDFSSDIGEEDYDDADKLSCLNTIQPHNNHHNSAEFIISDSAPRPGSFPVLEEELEWLSNEDAFPPIESFDISSLKQDNVVKNQSPVSVLGLSNSNFRVPVKARSKKRRRRRSFSDFPVHQWWHCYENKKKSVGGGRGGWRNSTTSSVVRRCLHCQADKTPQWRAGPLGPKTLCNACGVRYKSGRLLPEYRPASSPTFSEDLHSNSHRKVLDMRRLKQQDVFFHPGPDTGSKQRLLGNLEGLSRGGTLVGTNRQTVVMVELIWNKILTDLRAGSKFEGHKGHDQLLQSTDGDEFSLTRDLTHSKSLTGNLSHDYYTKPKGGRRRGWRNSKTSSVIRTCLHCQTDKTPQWREGPLGPKTLCNACGVKFKSGRLLPEYRPASSPTFSEELHSNSHRKVLDMRRLKQQDVFFHPPDTGPKKVIEETRMPATTLCSEVSALPRKKDIKVERGSVWAENSW